MSRIFWLIVFVVSGLIIYTTWYVEEYTDVFKSDRTNYTLQVGRVTNIGTCDGWNCKVEVVRPSGDLDYWTLNGTAIINMPVYRRCWDEGGSNWCDRDVRGNKYGNVPYDKIERFPEPPLEVL